MSCGGLARKMSGVCFANVIGEFAHERRGHQPVQAFNEFDAHCFQMDVESSNVHSWHFSDIRRARSNVCYWGISRQLPRPDASTGTTLSVITWPNQLICNTKLCFSGLWGSLAKIWHNWEWSFSYNPALKAPLLSLYVPGSQRTYLFTIFDSYNKKKQTVNMAGR